MDPNLFHIDWERTFEALAGIVLLSLIVERALAPLFENRRLIDRLAEGGFKELIAFALSFAVCWHWQFDAVSIIILAENTSHFGEAVTAATVAGGSKGSIKLFRDILGFQSSAYKEYKEGKLQSQSAPAAGPAPGTPAPAAIRTS